MSAVITRCNCGMVHDESARCADVAAAFIAANVIVDADADFMRLGASCLKARADFVFHRDELEIVAGLALWYQLTGAIAAIDDALGELRCSIATTRGLWDGIDPADIPMMTPREIVAAYRRATFQ